MDLSKRLSNYRQACLERGASDTSMSKDALGSKGFQLGYNKASDFISFSLNEDHLRSLRKTIDALASRDMAPCRGSNSMNESELQIVRLSYESERALFESFFPVSEFSKIYAKD